MFSVWFIVSCIWFHVSGIGFLCLVFGFWFPASGILFRFLSSSLMVSVIQDSGF